MIEILTLLLILELVIFVYVDYCKFDTIFTPISFLGIPFAVVLLLAVFVTPSLGFLPVNEYGIVLWFLGLLLFWLSGSLVTFATIESKVRSPYAGILVDSYVTSFVRFLSWIFIIILFASFTRSYLSHGTISGEGFSRDFASHGLAAHCLSLLRYNAAYLIAVRYEGKIQACLIVILTFCFLFLYNVKGAIIMTALVCLFSKMIMSQSKVNLWKIFCIILLGTTIFVLSYIIALGSFNFNFIIFHFLAYIVSGVVGLSEHLKQGLPVDIDFFLTIQPVVNLYNVLAGGEVAGTISEWWVTTSIVFAKQSNVKTFFGSIYLFSGMIKGMVVVLTLGLFSYSLLIATILKKDLLFLVLYLFIISSLLFGWFDYYLNDLFYYEVVVYIFMISVASKVLVLLSSDKNDDKFEYCKVVKR